MMRCFLRQLFSHQVPGSLVVTKEHIDFVEVRAHIRQEDFVGISSVKGAEPSPLKVRRLASAQPHS